jgi:hypothetical protein
MVLYRNCPVATHASRELMIMERLAAQQRFKLLCQRVIAAKRRLEAERLEAEQLAMEQLIVID